MDIQIGYYKARGIADTGQFGYAESGGEQISVELELQVSDQQFERVTTILSFSGKAIEYSIERLKALGWDGSDQLRGIDRNEVDVEVKYETNPRRPDDPPRMRVEIKTNGAGRFAFRRPMDAQEQRGFMTALSRTASQLANGQPAPAAAPGPGPARGRPAL